MISEHYSQEKIQGLYYTVQHIEEPIIKDIDRDWGFSICVKTKYNLMK